MSVQAIVEAYETRLRERWTPDGERKCPIVDLRWKNYVDGYVNSEAHADAVNKIRDAMNEPSPIWDNK